VTLAAVSLLAAALAAQPEAPAPTPTLRVDRELGSAGEMHLEAGQNRLLLLSEQIVRVAVADPTVADLKVVTPTQVLLTAKGPGTTDLTLWNKADQPLVIALQVARSVEALRRQLRELFPKENVSVSAAGDLVVLTGEVSDLRIPERMTEVARLHAKHVANLVSVTGTHQVQLEVRFAEVSRTGLKAIGVNLFGSSKAGDKVGGQIGPGNTLGGSVAVPGTGGSGPPLFPAQPLSQAFQLFYGATTPIPFNITLSLLEQKGLARVLAEPTLVTLSGQEAKFLAGGELPVPISSTLGQINVAWKKFGIQLAFTPTVLDEGTINLRLAAEVSDIDPTIGIVATGINIPGLTSRQTEATLRMGDGQSFAVAGLMSDKVRSNIDQVPWLGSLPILGALFRSSNYKREETELLVVVTARLVKPVPPHLAPALPTDYEENAPDNFSFYMNGWESAGNAKESPQARRGSSGATGFAP
jgi:pilus assembly protein CpaC